MDTNLIKQLRKRLHDVLTPSDTDTLLYKWLKAGNFCLRRCEYLFRENLACAILHEVDILEDKFKKHEIINNYGFESPLGFAKDGTPLTYVAMGRGDYRGFMQSMSSWDICEYCSSRFEYDIKRCKEQTLKLGKEINEVTYIIDMDGFSLKRAADAEVLELALDLFRMMQDHYPSRWKVLLIVNAAFYVYQAFNIFKPIFRTFMLQDAHVVSKENTPSLLLKYIDEDVLPVFLGGKKVDSNGDPMCREFLKFGGTVPSHLFVQSQTYLLPDEPGVQRVWIRAKCLYNHSLVVKRPNSRVRIELRTEGGSLSMSILLKKLRPNTNRQEIPGIHEHLNDRDDSGDVKLISPCVKMQTHLTPVDAYLTLPWKGIYIFRFDNYYNWISGRALFFRIQLEPPNS